MKWLLQFLVLQCLCFQIAAATDCIQVANPSLRMIYLHGMDVPSKSGQEKHIRKLLHKFSKKNNIEIALIRATMKCPNHEHQICWMWDREENEKVALKKKEILTASKKCFTSKKPLVWLGFSNGGNFVSQIFQECSEKGYFITFGSSGGYIKSERQDLSSCGLYLTAIGKKDKWNYSNSLKFHDRLKSAKGNVKIVEFDGSHEVAPSILEDFAILLKEKI